MAHSVSIRRGDTMSAIAVRNRITLKSLRAANPGIDPRKLQIGKKLQLPHQRDGFEPARARRPAAAPARHAHPPHTHAPTPRNTRTAPSPTSTRPADRVAYRNGRIPSNALTDVGGGHKMYGNAAKAYTDMRNAARNAGVNIRLTDSYRTYAGQVDVARRKGIYGVRQPNGRLGLAARPGTSNHGLGRAVDVNLPASPGASTWLKANAARYGFHTIPREPWHWEFRGS